MISNNNNNKLVAKEVIENNPHKLYAITIDNVFSKEECKEWIELSEANGYEAALINVGYGQQILRTDIRNNDRSIIDSDEMANKIFERVKEFIPKTFRGYDGNDKQVVSVNERLRFLRYYPGQEFKAHSDGNYRRESGPKKGEMSYITLQLYLNDVEKGGETTFIFGDNKINVNPTTGMVLLFEHNLYHQGSPVIQGTKYVVRTDVMYIINSQPFFNCDKLKCSSKNTKCKIYGCSPMFGCFETSKCPQQNVDMCHTNSCVESTGECIANPLVCDDGLDNTRDWCHPGYGCQVEILE